MPDERMTKSFNPVWVIWAPCTCGFQRERSLNKVGGAGRPQGLGRGVVRPVVGVIRAAG